MSVLVFQTLDGDVEANPKLFQKCGFVVDYLKRLGEESDDGDEEQNEQNNGKIYIFLKFTDQKTFRSVMKFLQAPSDPHNHNTKIGKLLQALEYHDSKEEKDETKEKKKTKETKQGRLETINGELLGYFTKGQTAFEAISDISKASKITMVYLDHKPIKPDTKLDISRVYYGTNINFREGETCVASPVNYLWAEKYGKFWKVPSYLMTKYGKLETLKYFIASGQHVDEWACIWAAKYGQLEIVKYLVKSGQPVDKWACQYVATRNGHEDVVKYLQSFTNLN